MYDRADIILKYNYTDQIGLVKGRASRGSVEGDFEDIRALIHNVMPYSTMLTHCDGILGSHCM